LSILMRNDKMREEVYLGRPGLSVRLGAGRKLLKNRGEREGA